MDGLRVFPTIAYQLADSIHGFRAPLVKALRDDRETYRSDLSTQLQELILVPLRTAIDSAPSPIVIVLDALNECEDSSHATDIVKHLANIASKLPNKCRLRVLITSRPEPDLEATMHAIISDKGVNSRSVGKVEGNSAVNLQVASLDDIQPPIIKEDIRTYLKASLQSKMPIVTDVEIEQLLGIAQGLFIVASIVVRFLNDSHSPNTEDLKDRVTFLLSTPRAAGAPKPGSRATSSMVPFSPLDLLYSDILQLALSRWRERHLDKAAPEVIGAMALLFNPLPAQSLDALLQLAPNTVTNALQPLYSVVSVSSPDETNSTPPRLIHPSFSNFLTTPSRCTDASFLVNPTFQHARIALLCLDHMSETLNRDMCGIGSLPILNSDVTDLHHRLQVRIPLYLRYACFYWPLHLIRAKLSGYADRDIRKTVVLQLVDAFGKFVRTKLLCWLEVMSLLGQLDVVVPFLQMIRRGLKGMNDLSETLEVVRDVQQFVTRFFNPISESAGDIYSSALPLTPQCRLYNQYEFELTQPNASAVVRFGRGTDWSQAASQHRSSVTSVAFSPNGAYIAAAFSDESVQLWAHIGLALATLVDPAAPSHSKANLSDGHRPSAHSDHKTVQVYERRERSEVPAGSGDGGAGGSVSFTPDSRQLVFRSSTGKYTWAQDITRYPVAIAPKTIGVAGALQWEYPCVMYFDWRLCHLGAPNWTWASRGHQIILGAPTGEVLLLDFSPVIPLVDKYRTQGIAPNNPLPFRYAP
ncbi:hypothetical protein FRB93_006898 [Tulasnella sp. JGI-2019a]|nr:hypothetical protein FRB93_006898 [Tulasnella sp. JGI-2019a]